MANTLRGSVGLNGNNWYTDISTIQQMLNIIPVIYGGAAPPFFTFGTYSQDLVDAIRNFQQMNRLYCDGRIDVNGATFRKLMELQGVHLPPETPGTPSKVPGVTPPAPKPQEVHVERVFRGYRATPWAFTGSAGLGGGASVISASWGYVKVKHDRTKEEGTLYYAAAGGGLSLEKAGVQFSTGSMPSGGWGYILASPNVQRDLTLDDMSGPGGLLGGSLLSITLAPMGATVTIFFLGANMMLSPNFLVGAMTGGIVQLTSLATVARAIGIMWGTSKGTPTLGFSIQTGYFY